MFKRITAKILCLAILISLCGINVFASKRNNTSEVSLSLLEDLGIVNSDIESLDNVMSREEFSVYMTKVLKIDGKTPGNIRFFSDVEADGYAVDAINTLAEYGLVSVGEDRKFRPQDGILIEEAAKILVTALGYKDMAEQSGGYPGGYISVASRIGILKDVDFSDSVVTIGKAFTMLANAMEAPLAKMELSYDGYEANYDYDDEYTILTRIWKLNFIKGTVKTVYGMSMEDNLVLNENEIHINDEAFILNEGLNPDEFFGEYVEGYYRVSDNESDKIMHLRYAKSDEKVTVIPENFKSIEGNTITYYNESRHEKRISLEEPVYVYNGYPIKTGVSEKLSNIKKGSIEIKDSDGDSEYDLVIIKNYENFVVSNADSEKAYNKLGGAPIEWDTYRNVKISLQGGIDYTIADVKAGQSLSVARSENNQIVEAIISETTVTGKIEYFENIDNKLMLTVNSTVYPVDKSYAGVVESTYLKNISYGDTYEFLIDAFGNIAYMSKKDSELKTGYIITGYNDKDNDDKASLRILTEESNIDVFKLAEKVAVNGKNYKSSIDAYKNLPGNTTLLDKVTVKRQVIRYMLNGEGEIAKILTASSNAWNEPTQGGFLQILEKDEQQRYVRGRFGKKITLSEASKVFFIPRDETNLDETNCGVTNYNSLETDEIYLSNGYLFSPENILADAAVCYYTQEQIPKNTTVTKPVVMVSEITTKLNSDDEVCHNIVGYSNGGRIEVNVPYEVSVADIEVGDIVVFEFDYKGNVVSGADSYEILVKRSDIENNGKPTWTNHEKYDYLYTNSSDATSDFYRAVFQLSFGHVLKTNGNAIAFDHELDGIFDETILFSGNVMVYDSKADKENRVKTAKVSDILTYESVGADCAKIIVRTRGQVVLEAFIYQ